MKTPDQLTPAELRKAITRAASEASAICDALIAAGRGHERPSETRLKDDPLSLRWCKGAARSAELNTEKERRVTWHGSLKRIVSKEC